MNVYKMWFQLFVCIDHKRFEPALKLVPGPVTITIEMGHIAAIDPLDSTAQNQMQGFNQEMVVIGYQTECVHLNIEPIKVRCFCVLLS